MTTIINPRRINRTIVVERDSRTLTARVIDALDAPNGMAEMLADAQQARDDAQAAQVIAETARDESVVAGNQAVQAAADASASEGNAASSESIATAAASTAVSARDAAVAARDAAQTAQGLAEAARTGAEAARAGAESAQAAAGTHAANAQAARTGAEAARDAAATSATNAATSEGNTNADAIATAADRVQTGLDAQATAADRVQTGLDRSAAAASASAAALSASMANGMPLGTIAHFAASVPPDGWLVCDGTAVTALYPDLRAFLLDAGSPYGVSGADPLLPDLRGEFLRGWDGGRGVDAGRVFGSAQGDALQDHNHLQGDSSYSPRTKLFGRTATPNTTTRPGGNDTGSIDTPYTSKLSDAAGSANARYAAETRPRNVALLPCIRAYATEDQSKILGVGQEWRNLIRARAAGEEYENTTGRTIQVNLTGKSSAAEGRVVETKQGAGAWVPVGYLPGSAAPVDGSASFTVPAAARYRVNGAGVMRYWSELRTLIDPATLFANGEQGAWFDPSDLTSMYQDAAGTIPAAIGQPVGLILDKSGNGHHASQATTTARPTLSQDVDGRSYLSFDGIDDMLSRPWALGWAAPAELHWLGRSNGASGAITDGLGIQYSSSANRFGALVSGNWAFGVPIASGRETVNTSDGNMGAVAVRGGSATDDLMIAYRDGFALASKVPDVALGTVQSGTLRVGYTGYQSAFYGGAMIFRELAPAERKHLVDYFYGATA